MKTKKSVGENIRFLAVSFSAVIILITALSIMVYSRIQDTRISKIQQTNLLQAFVSNFNSVIYQYHELSVEMSGTPTLRNFVFNNFSSPGKDTSAVKSQLAIAKSQHAYLSGIWLYDVRTGAIIDDQYHYSDLSSSIRADVTSKYLEESDSLTRIFYNGYSSYILLEEDVIYIVREFPVLGSNRLGILFLELNAGSIVNDYFISNTKAAETYLVFDKYNKMIQPISSTISDPKPIVEMLEDKVIHRVIDGKDCVIVDSDVLGWHFCALYHQNSHIDLQLLIMVLAPVLLLLITLSLLFSRYLYKFFVEPLEKLTKSVRSTYDIKEENEFDAISQSLSQSSQSIQAFNAAITNISPQMAENIFSNLYDGIPMPMSYIRSALSILRIPFSLNGIYWTIVITYSSKFVETERISAVVSDTVQKLDQEDIIFHINPYPNHTVVLFEMPNSDSVNFRVKKVFSSIVKQLSVLPFPMRIGKGELAYNFTDVHHSYVSAISDTRDIDTVTSEDLQSGTSGAESAELNTEKQIKAFVNGLLKLVDENRLWQAKEDLSCRLTLLANENPECFRNTCRMLTVAVAEHEKLSGVLENEQAAANSQEFTDDLPTEEIRIRAQTTCTSYLDALDDRNKKHSYQIVNMAKKYIDQHFADPEISLTIVAAAIKTSPGYLSKMFKNYESSNFINYLNECRIREACRLLTETEQPMKEVLLCCGFLSEQNFFRVFKKVTSMTPKQYRDTHKKMKK